MLVQALTTTVVNANSLSTTYLRHLWMTVPHHRSGQVMTNSGGVRSEPTGLHTARSNDKAVAQRQGCVPRNQRSQAKTWTDAITTATVMEYACIQLGANCSTVLRKCSRAPKLNT